MNFNQTGVVISGLAIFIANLIVANIFLRNLAAWAASRNPTGRLASTLAFVS